MTPDFPFLARDIIWSEVPIILWLVSAIVTMLIVSARVGRSRARDVLRKYRWFWGVSLAIAVALAAALHVATGQPMAMYL